jgi:hypothetical protein
MSLSVIATQVRIDPILLDEFLTGERTLRSDVLDRLASILGYDLSPTHTGAQSIVGGCRSAKETDNA